MVPLLHIGLMHDLHQYCRVTFTKYRLSRIDQSVNIVCVANGRATWGSVGGTEPAKIYVINMLRMEIT